MSALRDLATSVDIVVVTIPADVVKKTNDPAYLSATIPANTYAGQTTDVQAAAVQNFLVTHDGVSNDTVYEMTKALWTNLDQLIAAHSAAKAIDIKNALDGHARTAASGRRKVLQGSGSAEVTCARGLTRWLARRDADDESTGSDSGFDETGVRRELSGADGEGRRRDRARVFHLPAHHRGVRAAVEPADALDARRLPARAVVPIHAAGENGRTRTRVPGTTGHSPRSHSRSRPIT